MKFEASVFKESHRRKILEERNSLVGYIILGFSIFLILMEYKIGILLFFGTGIFYFIWILIRWNKVEPNFGSFLFKMTISGKGIKLKDKLYPISEISLTRFSVLDFRGKLKTRRLSGIKYPMKSNGTDNHIHFTYNQSKYELRFRIDHKKHFEEAEKLRKIILNQFN